METIGRQQDLKIKQLVSSHFIGFQASVRLHLKEVAVECVVDHILDFRAQSANERK